MDETTMASEASDFIGRGLRFPLSVDHTGAIAWATGPDALDRSLRVILSTAKGERPMRPEFGCRIHEFLFASADGETANSIGNEVRSALRRWEPRIDVHDATVSFDEEDGSILYIDIRYSIGTSNDPRNLVFPFYTIPTEE